MREYRVQTRQAHPVPTRVGAHGPFPRELYAHTEIITDYVPEGEDEFPPGATPQNNFRPPRMLTCRLCLAEVPEPQTPDHVCPTNSEDHDVD